MEKRTIDIKGGSETVKSFEAHLEEEDKKRTKLPQVKVDELREDIIKLAVWGQRPENQAWQVQHAQKIKEFEKQNRIPDLEKTCPAFWEAAQKAFPQVCAKSPSPVKMAITEGASPSFGRDLEVLLSSIAKAQNGGTVKECTKTMLSHLQKSYYKEK